MRLKFKGIYDFMHLALEQARCSLKLNELPVGSVIVKDNKIIATGFNKREKSNSTINHAEIIAIQNANKKLNSWRLLDCDIYITLEPCPMCAGAILEARFKRLIFGAYNFLWGACGTVINIFKYFPYGNKIEIIGGIMEKECSELLKQFEFNR